MPMGKPAFTGQSAFHPNHLAVACPFCGAAPGSNCRGRSAQTLSGSHNQRILCARVAQSHFLPSRGLLRTLTQIRQQSQAVSQ